MQQTRLKHLRIINIDLSKVAKEFVGSCENRLCAFEHFKVFMSLVPMYIEQSFRLFTKCIIFS